MIRRLLERELFGKLLDAVKNFLLKGRVIDKGFYAGLFMFVWLFFLDDMTLQDSLCKAFQFTILMIVFMPIVGLVRECLSKQFKKKMR